MAIETSIATKIAEERRMRLIQNRVSRSAATDIQEDSAPKTEINFIEGILMVSLAAITDIADFFIIGSIPILGDVFDLFTAGIIYLWVKVRGLDANYKYISWIIGGSALTELFPFIGDIPPSFTISVLVIIIMNSSQAQKILKRLWKVAKFAKFAV